MIICLLLKRCLQFTLKLVNLHLFGTTKVWVEAIFALGKHIIIKFIHKVLWSVTDLVLWFIANMKDSFWVIQRVAKLTYWLILRVCSLCNWGTVQHRFLQAVYFTIALVLLLIQLTHKMRSLRLINFTRQIVFFYNLRLSKWLKFFLIKLLVIVKLVNNGRSLQDPI